MPENADNKAVTWSSSAPEIVSVNENGFVTAVANEGEATIIVTTQDGGKTASCKVKVTPKTIHVTEIALTPTELTLIEEQTASLTLTITPQNATNKSVKWESTNQSVASIDQEGNITAKSAGITIIKVTTQDGNKIATCQVNVIQPYITMVTQKSTTEKLKLIVRVAKEADKAGVWIDLNNNGTKDEGEKITNFRSAQQYTFTSPTITLYGKVTYLDCRENQLSQLDVSKNKELRDLECVKNQLSQLTISENSQLTELKCYDNRLPQEVMSKLLRDLPTISGEKKGKANIAGNLADQNYRNITQEQKQKAREKNWDLYIYNNNNWEVINP